MLRGASGASIKNGVAHGVAPCLHASGNLGWLDAGASPGCFQPNTRPGARQRGA